MILQLIEILGNRKITKIPSDNLITIWTTKVRTNWKICGQTKYIRQLAKAIENDDLDDLQ